MCWVSSWRRQPLTFAELSCAGVWQPVAGEQPWVGIKVMETFARAGPVEGERGQAGGELQGVLFEGWAMMEGGGV